MNFEKELLKNNLIRLDQQNLKFYNKESYVSNSVGKKGNKKYSELDYFIKLDNQKFIHLKIAIYGDSLVDERICEAIQLIETIKMN
ncbi:hypothetical protein [Polaribacter sp. M15]